MISLIKHTEYKNHLPKRFSYIMYADYTNISTTPRVFLSAISIVSDMPGYKNMPDIRILYAIPNNVLITGIHKKMRDHLARCIHNSI